MNLEKARNRLQLQKASSCCWPRGLSSCARLSSATSEEGDAVLTLHPCRTTPVSRQSTRFSAPPSSTLFSTSGTVHLLPQRQSTEKQNGNSLSWCAFALFFKTRAAHWPYSWAFFAWNASGLVTRQVLEGQGWHWTVGGCKWEKAKRSRGWRRAGSLSLELVWDNGICKSGKWGRCVLWRPRAIVLLPWCLIAWPLCFEWRCWIEGE